MSCSWEKTEKKRQCRQHEMKIVARRTCCVSASCLVRMWILAGRHEPRSMRMGVFPSSAIMMLLEDGSGGELVRARSSTRPEREADSRSWRKENEQRSRGAEVST